MFSWCRINWKNNFQIIVICQINFWPSKLQLFLALTSASTVTALQILDTRFMVKTSQKYVFKFHKLHKSWRHGQKPTTLELVPFFQDKDLRIVSALDEYLNRTKEWRRVNNETQLLLSYTQPHKKVVPSTNFSMAKKCSKIIWY